MPDDLFRAFWRSHYGDCPPVGFLMRETFPDRWFRIHSLPESKRYASSAAELARLLARHNTIVTDLLGEGAPCVLVADPEYATHDPARARGERQFVALDLQPLMTIVEKEPKDINEAWSLSLAATRIQWRPRALDDVLTDVANHLLGPLLIVAEGSGRVYAPYDGGADLFLESSAERDAFRSKYASWLSPDPTGL
jgi:hypothetical protein